jgi:UDP-N-acetylglucosamine--dolichyl-phosphate N-acetylglucosaminephosphotransferase
LLLGTKNVVIMPLPRAKDYHKPGQPLVPNCYGVFYALISVCYWFILSSLGIMKDEALALATSVLFGSTMGLFDDMVDLPWRYKALLPIFASLPYIGLKPLGKTTIWLPFLGIVNLGEYFFILMTPFIVTVTTNTYNQLGGLNGLESISGLIILVGLIIASDAIFLLLIPVVCLFTLAYFNYNGKLFIGNVGTFSIGLTLAVYAILMNLKLFLLISLSPFIFNSILILFSNYVLHERAETLLDENGLLYSHKVRSLRTLILHFKRLSEHQTVLVIHLIVIFFTVIALIQRFFYQF